jgi:hypothetical protein
MNSFSLRPLRLTVLLAGLAALSHAVHASVVNINITDTRGDGTTTTDDTIARPYSSVFDRTIREWLGPNSGTISLINVPFDPNARDNGIGIFGSAAVVLDGSVPPPRPTIRSSELIFSAGTNSATPTRFLAGDSIDSTRSWQSGSDNQLFQDNDPSLITAPAFGSGSYLGFRIENRLSAGTYNYGWLEVRWNSTIPNEFEILSGAYETTANTAILAGATAPSPGPSSSVPDSSSTGALGLLLGSVLVRHWRRQRRTA